METKRVVSNSSAALRQQIAAAKAAARKAQAPKHDSPHDALSNGDAALQDDFHIDPFNQAPRDEKHILRNRINTARMSGKLNIAAMNLKTIPDEVLRMYDSASMTESNVNWAEVVDLTRFIAADNEIVEFDDGVFPDRSAAEMADDEDAEGNQFGGLESLDLHGNSLLSLPLGLRRLERLTSLNVANNKLDNAAFDIIAQIPTLKELRLGHNNLDGNLPTSVCELQYLELLDLQHNRLLGLPEAIRELTSLRVLNVSNNQLTTIPMEALQSIPLADLDASSNALIGSLFPMGGQKGHSALQHLNLANNSLAALAFTETLDMPRLETLNITNNHMTILPSVASWTRLITFAVGDNKLTDFPHGFTSLSTLRNVNFTSNDIRMLDPEIACMEGLESLLLAANPLREKKFLTMSAADIKRDLKTRLVPAQSEDASSRPESPVTVGGEEESSSQWTLKGNGLLDLAAQSLTDEVLDTTLSEFLTHQSTELKQLHLQHNKLTMLPPSLQLTSNLRLLDLSGNSLSAQSYLTTPLSLHALTELNLSKCNLTTLSPLLDNLDAPVISTLNISVNRLSGPLPALRHNFPALTTLFASDNKFVSISAEALRGMHTVNLASNDLQALPAEVGLLWEEGLRILEVGSNAFRVPGWRVLEKGTEGVLRWLRGRLPAGEGGLDLDLE
jgi:Leucine-rich repeat (LRR) protein